MTADETKHITPDAPRSLSNTPEFPSPEWYAKVRGKKTGRPASEEPQELKEALDTMERQDATGNELIAARTTISRYVAKQREEIASLRRQFYETQQSSSDEVLGLKAQLERQRETTLTPEEARRAAYWLDTCLADSPENSALLANLRRIASRGTDK